MVTLHSSAGEGAAMHVVYDTLSEWSDRKRIDPLATHDSVHPSRKSYFKASVGNVQDHWQRIATGIGTVEPGLSRTQSTRLMMIITAILSCLSVYRCHQVDIHWLLYQPRQLARS